MDVSDSSSSPFAGDVEPFPSMSALRTANLDLAEQRRHTGDSLELLEAVAIFLRRASATGVLLDDGEERWNAQGLLDYWDTVLDRAGLPAPEATLVEFDPLLAPELPESACPYLGLDAFGEANAAIFFGRRRVVAELVERLRDHRLLAVVGPSGSGKSSLVRAGLLPALRADGMPGSAEWQILPPMVPGSDPSTALDRALGSGIGGRESSADSRPPISDPLLLIIDQFEETFTLCTDETRRKGFLSRLVAMATDAGVPHRVVLTMRSDFEPFIARAEALQPLYEAGKVTLPPLTAGELRETIERPAEQAGLKFEAGVVDALLGDILGEPAALPLLQYSLLKLWEARERNRVPLAAYKQIGGGRLALARGADAAYTKLIPEEQMTAKRILLRLVRPGDGLEITSNRVRRIELDRGGEDPGRVARVLEKLVAARLLRLSPSDAPDDTQVEVAHEALVRNWPTLVGWLEDEREALRHRQRLTSAAEQWAQLGRDSAGLLRGALLDAALGYRDLNDAEQEFTQASLAAQQAAERELETARLHELDQARSLADAEHRRAVAQAHFARRLAWLSGSLAVVVIVCIFLAYTALQQRNIAQDAQAQAEQQRNIAQDSQAQAEQQRDRATALAFAGRALGQLDRQPTESLLMALAAGVEPKTADQILVQRALFTTLSRPLVRLTFAHPDGVRVVSWRPPDGSQLLTVSEDGRVRVWDGETGQIVHASPEQVGLIQAAVWRPDGQRIALGSKDGTIQIWNTANDTFQMIPARLTSMRTLAWSPDSNRLFMADDDKTAQIWNLTITTRLRPLIGYEGGMRSAAWSPDGLQIATGDEKGTVRIWDAQSGQELLHFAGSSIPGRYSHVLSVAWSPDGTYIATGSANHLVRVWFAKTGDLWQTLDGHRSEVRTLAWSTDGTMLATGGQDSMVLIWDIASGKILHTLSGLSGSVWSVAWNNDGTRLFTGGGDGLARVWDLKGALAGDTLSAVQSVGETRAAAWSLDGRRVLIVTSRGTTLVRDVVTGAQIARFGSDIDIQTTAAWSPDGSQILTGSADGMLRLWALADSTLVAELPGHLERVQEVAWSPDGQRVLSGSADGTARIWDLATKTEVDQFRVQQGQILAVAWSPDGKQVLIGGENDMAWIWDLATDKQRALVEKGQSYVDAVAWSPDGQLALTGGADGVIRIWQGEQARAITRLHGHGGLIWAVAWAPDGQYIASAGQDGTTRLWDVASGEELSLIHSSVGAAFVVAWHAGTDGLLLLSGGAEGAVQTWIIESDLLVADLTRRVCRLYGGDEARIQANIPTWPGCATRLAALSDLLNRYDRLREVVS